MLIKLRTLIVFGRSGGPPVPGEKWPLLSSTQLWNAQTPQFTGAKTLKARGE